MVGDVQPHTVLSWEQFTEVTHVQSRRIRRDGVPEVVVGVLRGGMVPAVVLAHCLGCRTIRGVEVVATLSDEMNAAKLDRPQVLNPASLGVLEGADVLVVDDVAGSGQTCVTAADLVNCAGAARVRTAVTVVNLLNWRLPTSPVRTFTYVGIEHEGWVVFPWETRQ